MSLKETCLESSLIFDGSFIKIHQDTVRLPNGNSSQRVWIHHSGAACVLAVTEAKQVVLVRQWRYATGAALLEVPAGKLDEGEDPAVCALRELAEETPYAAESVEKIGEFYTAPGFCDELMHLYLAKNVRAESTLNPDQDEFVETVLLDKEQVREAIRHGHIRDAKTLIALHHWLVECS